MSDLVFEQHVRRHQDRVYGYACAMLHDADAAADVTQEVFLRLWRHQDAVDTDRMGAWLLRVTRNACIDALRARQARRRVEVPDTDGVGRARGHAPSPLEQTQNACFRARLDDAIAGLAEPYRSLIVLRELQGLAYAEIVEALDLPLTSVKVYLHRARRMLRHALSEVSDRATA